MSLLGRGLKLQKDNHHNVKAVEVEMALVISSLCRCLTKIKVVSNLQQTSQESCQLQVTGLKRISPLRKIK